MKIAWLFASFVAGLAITWIVRNVSRQLNLVAHPKEIVPQHRGPVAYTGGVAIAITVMLRTVWIATFADLIFVMTAGGPAGSTNTIATYIYVSAFRALDKGYASAVAVLLLVLLIIYALIIIQIRRILMKDS